MAKTLQRITIRKRTFVNFTITDIILRGNIVMLNYYENLNVLLDLPLIPTRYLMSRYHDSWNTCR